ncbi:MAG TPA: efflux RND transporter permease subunit [Spirochaetia bacterium]|nr:efflux RND transporter permease subunit [Spirochaetales bacterium]HRS66175.1 efflux RND transporter permease subunit [Spirochaetia bacterium]HRV28154.1 efflux RND transporter permease subunit [Spirochaetia bacterium]
MKHWIERIVSVTALLIVITLISIFIVTKAQFSTGELTNNRLIEVTIRHYGVDARELERTIAIPVENAITGIEGCEEIITSIEYSTVRISILYGVNQNDADMYEKFSEAVYRVYETMPESVQRPEFALASSDDFPIFTAAIYPENISDVSYVLEKELKPDLKKINGAGDVEIYGIRIPEIAIDIIEDKVALTPQTIIGIGTGIAENDILKRAGYITEGSIQIPLTIDGRYKTISDLKTAWISGIDGTPVRPGDFAVIAKQERKPDSISRVNGKHCMVLAIKRAGNASLIELSASIKAAIKKWEQKGLTFTILADAGEKARESLSAMVNSVLSGMMLVGLGVFFITLYKKSNHVLLLAVLGTAFVPIVIVITLAVLVLLKFSIDTWVLAGIVSGVGCAVDAILLLLEESATMNTADAAVIRLKKLFPPLAGGVLTTIIALAPLMVYTEFGYGIQRTACAIAIVNLIALLAGILFIPSFLVAIANKTIAYTSECYGMGKRKQPSCLEKLKEINNSLKHTCKKILFFILTRLIVNKKILLYVVIIIVGTAVVALIFIERDPTLPDLEGTIPVHAELASGTAMDIVDEVLATVSEKILGIEGVDSVQSTAYRGYGTLLVVYDMHRYKRDAIIREIRSLSNTSVFLWTEMHETNKRIWQVSIQGDEINQCELYARKLASLCSNLSFVSDVVLNFKEGAPELIYQPDRAKIATYGESFVYLGDILRYSLYNPVVYKKIQNEQEMDVRLGVYRAHDAERSDILETLAPNGETELRTLGVIKEVYDTAKIYRNDRKRTMTISIETPVLSPAKVSKAILETSRVLDIPQGYSVQFDRDALLKESKLKEGSYYFIAAFVGILLVLTILANSWKDACVIMLVIPPSLAVPVLFLSMSGSSLNPALVCSFIAAAGMVVNAGVIMHESISSAVHTLPKTYANKNNAVRKLCSLALKERFITLFAASLTTIAGTFPMLFLKGEVNSVFRSFAFTSVWGVASSCVFTIMFLPMFANCYTGIKTKHRKEHVMDP